jgi:serine/threonine protein kinase
MPFKQINDIVKSNSPNIFEYQLLTLPSNKNSGTGIWAFATKDKVGNFFIKRYLTPKGPSSICDAVENARRTQACTDFLNWKNAVFTEVKKTNSPYLPRPEDFFQAENSFHITYKKLNSVPFDFSLSFDKKIEIFTKIVEAVCQLHKYNVVHADIKMNNIIFEKSSAVDFIPYVIDLDSAYINGQPNNEIITDILYQSPETLLYNNKAPSISKADLNTKSDVFSLAIVLYYLLFQNVPADAATTVIENKPFQFNYTTLNLEAWLEKKLDHLFQKMLSPLASRITSDEVLSLLKNLFVNKISMPKANYDKVKTLISLKEDKSIFEKSFKLDGDEYILDQVYLVDITKMFEGYNIIINQPHIDITNMKEKQVETKLKLRTTKSAPIFNPTSSPATSTINKKSAIKPNQTKKAKNEQKY